MNGLHYLPETLFYIVLEYHNFTLIMQMKKPEVYWIHFTGNQCEDILNTYDIKNLLYW